MPASKVRSTYLGSGEENVRWQRSHFNLRAAAPCVWERLRQVAQLRQWLPTRQRALGPDWRRRRIRRSVASTPRERLANPLAGGRKKASGGREIACPPPCRGPRKSQWGLPVIYTHMCQDAQQQKAMVHLATGCHQGHPTANLNTSSQVSWQHIVIC